MKIYIVSGNESLIIPINPAGLRITEKSKNKEQSVIGLGDVNIPDVRGLSEIKFESFFPFSWAHYCSVSMNELRRPIDYVSMIMRFKKSKQPVRLVFSGNMQQIMQANGNSSGLFLIEDMEYEIKAGEEHDIYYSIKFKQYRNYEPQKVTVKQNIVQAKPPVISKTPPTRPAPPKSPVVPKVNTYTVKSGDNLWNIARKYYGNGALYTRIASKNNISNPSLIWPGQKLVIP